MKVKTIVIKSTSGYCSVDEAYNDKLTITANSIGYEYVPSADDSIINEYQKWSYKTISSNYAHMFEMVANFIDKKIEDNLELYWTDCGTTSFVMTYEDGSTMIRDFPFPADDFEECFEVIRKIIPATEEIPKVIEKNDDLDDEEE